MVEKERKTKRGHLRRLFFHHFILNKRGLTLLIFMFALFFIAIGSFWWLFWGQYRAVTEDAYVAGNVVAIHPKIEGTITHIFADTTDVVEKDTPLIALDPIDSELALEKAQANLGEVVRLLRGKYASVEQLEARIAQYEAELLRAKNEYDRRLHLFDARAISEEDLQHAEQVLKSNKAMLNAAFQELNAARALVDNVDITEHPSLRLAALQVKEAYINWKRTIIYAPMNGMITKRNSQIGEHISIGRNMMSLVALDELWVNANFKESQLKHIRVGQNVRLKSDLYGREHVYHGTIKGIDAGTGSAFALIPAQNATGNWIKVVQRIPVRIALDLKEIERYPLRIGLSMKVTVDTRERGERLPIAQTVLDTTKYQIEEDNQFDQEADKMIHNIVQRNLNQLSDTDNE